MYYVMYEFILIIFSYMQIRLKYVISESSWTRLFLEYQDAFIR